MDDNLRSILAGLTPLYVLAGGALALTIRRPVDKGSADRDGLIDLILIGIALQCLHFTEEYVAGFYMHAPQFLGLAPWSGDFFVTFNMAWLAVWLVSAVGIRGGVRAAFFPIWFLALAMTANGIGHPLLSITSGGYFPGLYTSPLAGGVGLALVSRLVKATRHG